MAEAPFATYDSGPMSRSESEGVAPHPEFKAMLICDQALREEGSGKVSLIGIFENINASAIPFLHPSLAVYVQVTDAYGEYDLVLDLVRLDDMLVVGSGQGRALISDRLQPAEIVFHLQLLQFEKAGAYEFRLSSNKRFLARKSFRVLKLDQPTTEEKSP
jgi:hypothetical protein